MRNVCALVVIIAAAAACTTDAADDASLEPVARVVANGQNLNGQNLNGQNLNGSSLGTSVLWTSLQGVKLGGSTQLDSAWLEGSELVGTNGSSVRRGLDFLQAELVARSNTGATLRLRANHITAPAAAGDPWQYWVEYLETNNRWYPICLDGAAARPAIAIAGYWSPQTGGKVTDATKLTFACPQVGAIGKCIANGYRPWESAAGVALDGHHQACVRALRADYCGTGVSYTTDGKLINIYDALGIQLDTEDWQIEAEWDAAGARCFSPNNRSLDFVPCFRDRASSACGKQSNFNGGTLLMTEMPPLVTL